MCGLVGFMSLGRLHPPDSRQRVAKMLSLIQHRGPDGSGIWEDPDAGVSFGHARLAVIDQSELGAQPMISSNGNVLVFNGEIYNHREIREHCEKAGYAFRSSADTEAILAAYETSSGYTYLNTLRGMFAFGLWDPHRRELTLARDRFGIKPLYYVTENNVLYFASEAKALLPFLPEVEIDPLAISEYLIFQTYLGAETPFKGIKQLMPGETLSVRKGEIEVNKYWSLKYEIDFTRTEQETLELLTDLVDESIDLHLVSDAEIGAYISGGIDSSLIAAIASSKSDYEMRGYHGTFLEFPGYDESAFALAATKGKNLSLRIENFTHQESWDALKKAIYHLDYPTAGPGSIPQYLISGVAASEVKVVLGGQGGDEIFGGYARYLIGYLEQCLRAAIDGTSRNGNFVVTLESIIPNLGVLREYQPLLQKLWSSGLFGSMDSRYMKMVSRREETGPVLNWDALDADGVTQNFLKVFNDAGAVSKESYFDSMTHFDFKTLLPSLLQVEDRMSMAHGLESRVPLLDHNLVSFVASIPSDIKFKDGQLKRLLKVAFPGVLPSEILKRRDKMGFPVPLAEWTNGPLKTEFAGTLESLRDRKLPFINGDHLERMLTSQVKYARGLWALLSLELWHETFFDRDLSFAHA